MTSENEESQNETEYQKEMEIQYKAWLASQNEQGNYQVIVNGANGLESPILKSRQACEAWVSENLSVAIQKFRTGSYSIEKV